MGNCTSEKKEQIIFGPTLLCWIISTFFLLLVYLRPIRTRIQYTYDLCEKVNLKKKEKKIEIRIKKWKKNSKFGFHEFSFIIFFFVFIDEMEIPNQVNLYGQMVWFAFDSSYKDRTELAQRELIRIKCPPAGNCMNRTKRSTKKFCFFFVSSHFVFWISHGIAWWSFIVWTYLYFSMALNSPGNFGKPTTIATVRSSHHFSSVVFRRRRRPGHRLDFLINCIVRCA